MLKTSSPSSTPGEIKMFGSRGMRNDCSRKRRLVIFTAIFFQVIAVPLRSMGETTAAPHASTARISGTNVELNGTRLIPGATIFPGDRIRLGADSSAALQFGKNVVLAAPLTELVVETEGISLRSGRVQVRASGGNSFAVRGPFFRVSVASSGIASGAAEVIVSGARAQVSAVNGFAELATAGSDIPYRLRAGEVATLDVGETSADRVSGEVSIPQQAAASPAAGQVSRLIPEVQIERASQRVAAAVSAPIFWNDDLRSGAKGRAHIVLNDGSLLNLGSNSELRVLQHDAQAQQTSLDLAIGRMRGRVVKLTRPGAKFEIRTPVGVAGLVGTDFSLFATNDYVELIVFEGAVRFTISATGQAITVPTGQKLRISRNGVALGPLPVNAQEIQTARDLTDIGRVGQAGQAVLLNSPKGPILVSVSIAATVAAITIPLNLREPVSPSSPTANGTPQSVF